MIRRGGCTYRESMIQTLKTPATLRAQSNASVVEDVRKALKKRQENREKKKLPIGTSKAPTVIKQLDPTLDFGMRPFDVLLELGAATVPPLLHHLRLASRWAILRYGWALAAPTGPLSPLRLGPDAESLHYHHRTLMSEELGVGLACWVCGELLATQYQGANLLRVDAESALTPGTGPIIVPGSGTVNVSSVLKRPDFFWVAYEKGKILDVVVLECKGTHAARHVPKQLGDAMHQVAAVTTSGSGTLTLQAFGSHLNDERIELYGVDPEGSRALRGAPVAREARGDNKAIVRENVDGSYAILESGEFRRRLLDVSAGQLLCWAGLADQAQARLLRSSEVPTINLDNMEHRETEAGEFVGVSSELPVAGGVRYRSFFGLDKAIAASLISDDDELEATALADFAKRVEPARSRGTKLLEETLNSDTRPERQLSPGRDRDQPHASSPSKRKADAASHRHRAGVRHVALDNPGDERHVAGASLDGLFFEITAE